MGKGRKFIGKKRKGFKQISKKKKRNDKNEFVNKKAIFNRYKDKQKAEEDLLARKKIDHKFNQQPDQFSEEEDEANAYEQLVSCFTNKSTKKMAFNSDDDTESEMEQDSLEDGSIELDGVNSQDLENSSNEENDANDTDIDDSEAEIVSSVAVNTEVEQEDDAADDPFTTHLHYDISDEMLLALSPPVFEHHSKTWPTLGSLSILLPKPNSAVTEKRVGKLSLLEEKIYAPLPTVPVAFDNADFKKLFIKPQLHGNIVSANKANLIKRDLELKEVFTPLQKELFAILNNYQDLYYPERSFSNSEEIRYIYCLHIVNHMLKTRTKILHHNFKLSKKSDPTEEYRDQGLVRPKVVIMVPFKDAAYRVVKTIIDILVPKEAGQVVNKARFEDDFTGGQLVMPKKNPKPEDYELLFSGNTDDTFRLGMTLTKKTLKLYTEFYSSDIIIASPLGLRMIVGAEGEEDRDYDFLASIEILVLDQTDVFLMQNWDHLLHVLDHFHLQPKKTHNTDFSRVRSWAVNGWSKYYRQTLMFSSVLLPELKSILNRKCHNYAGRVLVANEPRAPALQQLLLPTPQVFNRFKAADPLSSVESRFEFFVKEVLPKYRDPLMAHTLIYVPSYFDYVRIRNYFKKNDISFVQICEYTKESKIARARDMFFHTEAHFLLYSERVHFYRRLRLKGVRHVVFYQPPSYPHFYTEICNLMQESYQNKYYGSECNTSATTLVCKYDAGRAAALLGTSRSVTVLSADNNTHMFITGA